METKTKINAIDDGQDIMITREFELPLEALFEAFCEKEIVEQWMGTTVLELENKNHGSYRFQTLDKNGTVLFACNGTIHKWNKDKQIIRTFEMENAPFPVQLEFLDFEKISDNKSKLTMQIVYRSAADRDRMLALPFAKGISMAHDRLETVVKNKITVAEKNM